MEFIRLYASSLSGSLTALSLGFHCPYALAVSIDSAVYFCRYAYRNCETYDDPQNPLFGKQFSAGVLIFVLVFAFLLFGVRVRLLLRSFVAAKLIHCMRKELRRRVDRYFEAP